MSDAYTVLARRYRSQNFDELVGQEAIAQTLKNAIKANRVAHAFLFTGTRGVGKTSSARILAKAINCPDRLPDGNPCGKCNSCKATAVGEDIDVIEIDGASNNSVDQIRELRQSAGIRPARSPYKIYIIDEVHMLTGGAFNALLKTLEEPPSHVKFIFATTDIHKVPATIISRCQRFDFKNIPTQKIAEHLMEIVKGEEATAEKEAIFRIARLGNGSMRDALSILDRVLSLGEKNITDKMLEDLLGRPPTAAIAQLVAALANGDAAAAITQADALLKEGLGVEQVLSELIEFLRNLMIVTACGKDSEILDVPAEARSAYTGLADKFDTPTLVHLIALCDQTLRSLKASTMHRALFDALIVRLALSEQFSSIKQLLANGQSHANPQIAGQKKSDLGLPPGEDSRIAVTGRVMDHDAAGLGSNEHGIDPEAAAAVLGSSAGDSAAHSPDAPDAPEENIYEVMKLHMKRKQEEQDAKWANKPRPNAPGTYGRPQPQKPAVAAPVIEKVADVSDLPAVWAAARQYLSVHARLLESVLGNGTHIRRLSAAPAEVMLEIPNNHSNFTNDKAKVKLEEALRNVTGLPLKLSVEFVEPSAPPPSMSNAPATTAAQRVPPEVVKAVNENAVIQKLQQMLDATVTQIEMVTESGEE